MRGLAAAYRRRGADPPFGDPGRDHGSGMEGYYWRIVDAERGRVLVVLCGICRSPSGRWALVALAAHPGGLVRHAIAEPASGDPRRFGVGAGELLTGSLGRLRLQLDDAHWIDAAVTPSVAWPRGRAGALGAAHLVPGLAQYWQPVLLDGEARGEACIGGERVSLDGSRVYAEKNWGPGFAGRWWWGQAGAFPDGDLTVAFAGGRCRCWPPGPPPPRSWCESARGCWRCAAAGPDWRLRGRASAGACASAPPVTGGARGGPAGNSPHVPRARAGTAAVGLRLSSLAGRRARLRSGQRTIIGANFRWPVWSSALGTLDRRAQRLRPHHRRKGPPRPRGHEPQAGAAVGWIDAGLG